jgi:hypothetical protein
VSRLPPYLQPFLLLFLYTRNSIIQKFKCLRRRTEGSGAPNRELPDVHLEKARSQSQAAQMLIHQQRSCLEKRLPRKVALKTRLEALDKHLSLPHLCSSDRHLRLVLPLEGIWTSVPL